MAAVNAFFYGCYLVWPTTQMHSYLNNFTFSLYGLNKGYMWNMLTCHFAHQGIFSVLIDSVFIGLLAQSFTQQYGPVMLGRTMLLSMFLGSGLLFFYHNMKRGMAHPYQGNDAIFRGIIYTFIFANP